MIKIRMGDIFGEFDDAEIIELIELEKKNEKDNFDKVVLENHSTLFLTLKKQKS